MDNDIESKQLQANGFAQHAASLPAGGQPDASAQAFDPAQSAAEEKNVVHDESGTPVSCMHEGENADLPARANDGGNEAMLRNASAKDNVPIHKDQRGSAVQSPSASQAPAGPLAHIFNGLSYAGLPLLILLSATLTFWGVWHVRDLWFSDEVRIADVFMNLRQSGWLTLALNGMPYADTPPLYFWLIDALAHIPRIDPLRALFLASALSHAMFLATVWLIARGTGHDRRVAFAAGLITLGCLLIDGLAGYVSMDLLFAALINMGMLCLYRGARKAYAPLWLLLGFLLLAAATLVNGPLGIALAICTSVVFLCWIGMPGRLSSRDGLPGFLLMLLILAGWLGYLYATGHDAYVRDMLGVQLTGRVLDGGRHAGPWWYYLPAAALCWLPWTLTVVFVNWIAAFRGLRTAWKQRKQQNGGAWLWIWLICGFALLAAVRAKLAIYMLPLAAPLAVLTARSLLALSPGRSRGFFCLSAVLLSIAGLALVAFDAYPLLKEFVPAGFLPAIPPVAEAMAGSIEGCIFIGSALIVLAVLVLLFVRLARPDGAILALCLGLAAVMAPYVYFTAPSLQGVLSPRSQAAAMAEMAKTGYAAAAYRTYPGVYAWHFNHLSGNDGTRAAVTDLNTPEARDAWIAAHPKTIMAMPAFEWEGWTDRPVNSSSIATAWMAGMQYVVAAINAAPDLLPPAQNNTAEQVPAAAPAMETPAGPNESAHADDSAGQALKELTGPDETPKTPSPANENAANAPATKEKAPESTQPAPLDDNPAALPAPDNAEPFTDDSAGQALKELAEPADAQKTASDPSGMPGQNMDDAADAGASR